MFFILLPTPQKYPFQLFFMISSIKCFKYIPFRINDFSICFFIATKTTHNLKMKTSWKRRDEKRWMELSSIEGVEHQVKHYISATVVSWICSRFKNEKKRKEGIQVIKLITISSCSFTVRNVQKVNQFYFAW